MRFGQWLRTLTGEEVRAARLRVEAANGYTTAAAERVKAVDLAIEMERARAGLGEAHHRITYIRELCAERVDHEEVDRQLGLLDDEIHQADRVLVL